MYSRTPSLTLSLTHTHKTHAGQIPSLTPHPLLDVNAGLDLSRGQASNNRDGRREKSSAVPSKDNHLLARYVSKLIDTFALAEFHTHNRLILW